MSNLRLSVKLMGAFVVVALITLVVGLAGWRGLASSGRAAEQLNSAQSVVNELLKREIDHQNWRGKVGEFQRNDNLTELAVEKDEHKCGFGMWYYGAGRKEAESSVPEIKDLLAQIEQPHARLHQSAVEIEKILKRGKEARKQAVQHYENVTLRELANVQKLFGAMRPKLEERVSEAQKQANASIRLTSTISLLSMIVGVLAALALGIFLTRSITNPIKRVIAGLTEGADQVASASSQVSGASQSLAEGASEQAAGLEETSASIEEMTSMTRQNADNASQANTLMAETGRVVDNANQSMAELTGSMQEISAASEETAKIIKTIDEIAFQTNLLALNAAVEAARAGEAGAGFAVVADEVRNLAMRAADAAKNTSQLIEGTVKKIRNGSDVVSKTNEAFASVAGGARRVGELVGEITAASQEQAQGIEQINKAVAEMDKVVQQNAAGAEESASASEELNAQAEQMKGYVAELVALVGGSENGETRDLLANASSRRPASALRKISTAMTKKTKGRDINAGVHHASKELRPEQVIPLEEGDFKEF